MGAACVNATVNLSCAAGRGFTGGALNFDFGNGPAACDALLTGAGVAGTPCTGSADCAAGFTCPAAATSACRACAALPTTGQPCTMGSTCFNSYCRAGTDGGSECAAYTPVDQPCTSSNQCDPATARLCGPTPTDGGSRLCLAKLTDGAPCLQSTTCASGYCNQRNRTDAGVRTCGTVADGQPCGASTDCLASSFCDGLTATAPGLCAPRLALAAPCSIQRAADPNDGCANGGACFDGFCRPRENQQQLGQQCRSTTLDCAMGTWCPALPNDGGYPSCIAQGAAGAMCGASAECQPGLRCTNNTCQPLGTAGQQCFSAQQCKATLTCPLVDAGMGFFACTPLAVPGGDCTASGVTCASGTNEGLGGFCLRDAGVGTCFAPLMLGDDCGAGTQCASGRCLTADGGGAAGNTRGTCAAPCVP